MMNSALLEAAGQLECRPIEFDCHPMTHLHQILIVDTYQLPAAIPPSIRFNTQAARHLYPDATYKMWNGEELRAFLQQHFDREVLWAFDTLAPYSFKSDLARFCLMYVIGGLYVDLGVRLMTRWNIPVACGVGAFRDVAFVTDNWASMQTGLLWSSPGQFEFAQAIRMIVENCRRRNYGSGPLYPTGPVVLGKAMAAGLLQREWTDVAYQRIGVCRYITPDSEMGNVVYVASEGELIAHRNKRLPGDLSHLGIEGGNNYNQIWKMRRVFGELEYIWPLADSRSVQAGLVRDNSGLHIPFGTSGHVAWGPYIPLADGCYRATWTFTSDTIAPRVHVDICADLGRTIIMEQSFNGHSLTGGTELSVDFTLDEPKCDVECRIGLFPDFRGSIKSLSIRALGVRRWRHDHPKLRLANGIRSASGISIDARADGLICSSPRLSVPKGRHVLEVQFSAVAVTSGLIDIEVSARAGATQLAHESVGRSALLENPIVRVAFYSPVDMGDVEFRISSNGQISASFVEFALFMQ